MVRWDVSYVTRFCHARRNIRKPHIVNAVFFEKKDDLGKMCDVLGFLLVGKKDGFSLEERNVNDDLYGTGIVCLAEESFSRRIWVEEGLEGISRGKDISVALQNDASMENMQMWNH